MKIKKTIYILSLPIRRLYWFVFRPKTYGVKCLIECGGKLFLIRNSYGKHGWTFPGGGIKRNESPENAVKREIQEEVGIVLGEVKKIGEYQNTWEYKKDIVYCYQAKIPDPKFIIDKNEISEAEWFGPKEIPDFRSSAFNKMLKMYKK